MLEAVAVEVEIALEVVFVPVGVLETLGMEVVCDAMDVDARCEEIDVVVFFLASRVAKSRASITGTSLATTATILPAVFK